jgi:hypothetical protein
VPRVTRLPSSSCASRRGSSRRRALHAVLRPSAG